MKMSLPALAAATAVILLPNLVWANPPMYSRGIDRNGTFTLQHPTGNTSILVGDYYVAYRGAGPVDVSTVVELLVNGSVIATDSDTLGIPTGPPPSCGNCGNNVCTPVKNGAGAFCMRLFALAGGSRCFCTTPIGIKPHVVTDLVDGDDIAVRLRPASGAASEPYDSDDQISWTVVNGQLQLNGPAAPGFPKWGLPLLAGLMLGIGALASSRRKRLA